MKPKFKVGDILLDKSNLESRIEIVSVGELSYIVLWLCVDLTFKSEQSITEFDANYGKIVSNSIVNSKLGRAVFRT